MARRLIANGYSRVYALKGGWREWVRADYPYEEKPSEQPAVVQGCIDCHEKVTPAVVEDWQRSKHSTNMVSCLLCHGPEHNSEKDVEKAAPVRPELCVMCHEAQGRQFSSGKHALAWQAAGALPGAHWQSMARLEGAQGCTRCHRIGFKAPEEIRKLRREGLGPGIASCDGCHGRHAFSVAEARRPEACRACHSGPDQPLWEIYGSSKHGIRRSLEEQKEPAGARQAPTCQNCHMQGGDHEVRAPWGFFGVRLPLPEEPQESTTRMTILQALGMIDFDGRPTERHALLKDLDMARITEESWQKARDKTAKSCRDCHPPELVARTLEQGDEILREADLLLSQAIRIVADLYADRVFSGPARPKAPYPDLLGAHPERTEIEERLYAMFSQHRTRAFQGAFHGSPEHAYSGLDAMRRELAEMRSEAERLRSNAKKGR
jgi:hydroxylamine dehydrogenase